MFFQEKENIIKINKDEYNYPDGFNRHFKQGDIVVISNGPHGTQISGFGDHIIGDKCLIIRMMGQNAKIRNLRNNQEEIIGLDCLLTPEDYNLYQAANKYNL